MTDCLDIPPVKRRPTPTPADLRRLLALPAFWAGCRATRAELGEVAADRRLATIERDVAGGIPVHGIPELREWLTYDPAWLVR